jgi:subtilisin family serine protease
VIVEDASAMIDLGARVDADIAKDFETYEINDRTTLKRLTATRYVVAMLRKDWDRARALIAQLRDLEDKPSEKLTMGLMANAIIAGVQAPPDRAHQVVRDNLRGSIDALPFDEIRENIKQGKSRSEIISRNLVIGSVAGSIDTVAVSGKLSQDFASALLSSAFTLQYYVPFQQDIGAAYAAALDAHREVPKKDIWGEREVTLQASDALTPVVIGIWDSGTDVSLFPSNLWVNKREMPANGKDDDKNGYVDDVNGIAWTLHSDLTTDLLIPVAELGPEAGRNKAYVKGLSDLQANLDSPDAQALRKELAGLPQERVKPFLEGLNQYSQYAHGTHVAGIAARGNPACRLLVARVTFDYHQVPENPTLEQAKKDADAMVRTVEYLKAQGVRAVNMSWGGDLKSIDRALEQNGYKGTPEERRAFARKLYDIAYVGLEEAVKKAPNTLFVIAAGNADNDVKFDEIFPSSFKLPNVVVVGAVDQAGDQTSFTSFGDIDVYANGYEVESTLPGGERIRLSGTSMAAPQVTNLAGQLWAIHPKLSVAEVKRLIVEAADAKKVGDRTIRLLNQKGSLALAGASGAAAGRSKPSAAH